MSLFNKKRDIVPINVTIVKLVYLKNPSTKFFVQCTKSKKKYRTDPVQTTNDLVNILSKTFSMNVKFYKKKKNLYKKKFLIFTIYTLVDGNKFKLKSWSHNISDLAKKQSLKFNLREKNNIFGKMRLNISISRKSLQAPISVQLNRHQTTLLGSITGIGVTTINSTQDRRISTVSSFLPPIPKLPFEVLISNECNEFLQHDPEHIVQTPKFSMNIISHCFHNVSQINTDFLLESLLTSIRSISNSTHSQNVYILVSLLHLIVTFMKRRWCQQSFVESMLEYTSSIFQNLIDQMKDLYWDQIVNTYPSEEIPQEICRWLTTVGSGQFCQSVFTGILFLFSASFGQNMCSKLCFSFCVREQEFTGLLPYVNEEPNCEYEMCDNIRNAIINCLSKGEIAY